MIIVLVLVFIIIIRYYSCLLFSLVFGLVPGRSQVITLRGAIVTVAGGNILDGL
jgi:hypothetical protein